MVIILVCIVLAGCGTTEIDRYTPDSTVMERKVREQLRLWHRAAAEGDFDGYFSRMSKGAVFLGTDRSERWKRKEFESFARPYFDGEEAWTYEQVETNVQVGPIAPMRIAWVDEVLWNDKYGHCRGTGIVIREPDGVCRIAHYSLAFLVPNEAAGEVVGVIRSAD